MTRKNRYGTTRRGRRSSRSFRRFVNKLSSRNANGIMAGRPVGPLAARAPTAACMRPERGGARPKVIAATMMPGMRRTNRGKCFLCGRFVGAGDDRSSKDDTKKGHASRIDLHMAVAHGEFSGDGPKFQLESRSDWKAELSLSPVIEGGCTHTDGLARSDCGEAYCVTCGSVRSSVPMLAGKGFGGPGRAAHKRRKYDWEKRRPGRPPVDFSPHWVFINQRLTEGAWVSKIIRELRLRGFSTTKTTLCKKLKQAAVKYMSRKEARTALSREPDYRKKIAGIQRLKWSEPEYRAMMIPLIQEGMRSGWEKRWLREPLERRFKLVDTGEVMIQVAQISHGNYIRTDFGPGLQPATGRII